MGRSFYVVFVASVFFLCSCNAQPSIDPLSSLRNATKDGKLPNESMVASIEAQNSGTKIGALARLLRARIKAESGDPMGAAQLLDSDIFERTTVVPDYALWLRGKSLLEANQFASAEKTFSNLINKYPDSLRIKSSRILMANSLLELGKFGELAAILNPLTSINDPEAISILAQAAERQGNIEEAAKNYRKIYFNAAGSKNGLDAEEWLKARRESMEPRDANELLLRAAQLSANQKYLESAADFDKLVLMFPKAVDSKLQLKRLKAASRAGSMASARNAFNAIPQNAIEKPEAYFELAKGFANQRNWGDAQATANEMRTRLPNSELTPKTFVTLGSIAGDQKRVLDEDYFMRTALSAFPNSVDVAKAQFGVAWVQHETANYPQSSQMLVEHLARYVNKDNTYRGQAGYWAARDSERAGKNDDACALYDGVSYRYGANWYGYLALERVANLRNQGKCLTPARFPSGSLIPKAVENLKVVTAAAETSTAKELKFAEKSDQLSTIGLFDWSIDELNEAKKTADNSPKINLALARHYKRKGDNVSALLALSKSYPDYSQMFPEELSREEWQIFYPLINWQEIKYFANVRNLDPYVVAGLIRQETVFNPNAKSNANAFGLMQLLVPTARTMARKYSSTPSNSISAGSLYNPRLNIELGTAYMREQLDKFGRIEYMAAAYNAGPGRMVRWRTELPAEMDEFAEAIPFAETRGYVKGVVRNSAQYRRLYDENGNFKPNVGTKTIRSAIDSSSIEQLSKNHPQVLVERSAR